MNHKAVPLNLPDADVIIELQPVFLEAFARGDYDRRLAYGETPDAPPSPADREWAAQISGAARGD